jgi:SNF2 family DNA or RNA helicase
MMHDLCFGLFCSSLVFSCPRKPNAPKRSLLPSRSQRQGTDEALPKIARSSKVRLSQDVEPFLQSRRHTEERRNLRREYETGVVKGRHPEHVTLHPLYPYQREGMLHLAFGERALLADEMGLGKTIQAVAACALLHHLGKVKGVLVVTPASLKTEWEEQSRRFTTLGLQLVFGPRTARLKAYTATEPPFSPL